MKGYIILFLLIHSIGWISLRAEEMSLIKGGTFVPLFKDNKLNNKELVKSFYLNVYPVTNKDFYEFTLANENWSIQNVKKIFVEDNYLKSWKESPSIKNELSPVVNISWFAARAYCSWKKKRLPTTSEWEFAARASESKYDASKDEAFVKRIMEWYSKPNSSRISEVGKGYKNLYGIFDLHGQIWEWVDDFSTSMVTGDSREDSSLNKNLFCGSGSIGANDFSNYAAFLRYGFRSSLKANYTLPNLGFRCAR